MEALATILFTISAGVWTGAIVFQSAVVAPAVFAALNEAAARSFLRILFPRFFRFGLICGAFMLAALIGFGAVAGWTATLFVLALGTVIMIILEAISLAIVPHINAARDAGPAGDATFARLHKASVLLTVAILIIGFAILAVIAAGGPAGV